VSDQRLVGPWIRRSRTTRYENEWIEIQHDEVTRPDGSPGIYGVVHFRTRAVGAVVLDERNRVLLVGQYRYTLERDSWEIPEGGSPHDEDPLDGIKRELAEETGYVAASWRELIRFSLSNSVTDEEGVIYVATGLTAGTARPEPSEELEVRWVAFDDALAMVERGEIHDAMTQVGLLALARERSRVNPPRRSAAG
jgi:8-oxo-dGTP pyrophosphatase MutT (NUDIX family)